MQGDWDRIFTQSCLNYFLNLKKSVNWDIDFNKSHTEAFFLNEQCENGNCGMFRSKTIVVKAKLIDTHDIGLTWLSL